MPRLHLGRIPFPVDGARWRLAENLRQVSRRIIGGVGRHGVAPGCGGVPAKAGQGGGRAGMVGRQ